MDGVHDEETDAALSWEAFELARELGRGDGGDMLTAESLFAIMEEPTNRETPSESKPTSVANLSRGCDTSSPSQGASSLYYSRDPSVHVCLGPRCPLIIANDDSTFACSVTGICFGQYTHNDPVTAGVIQTRDENGILRGSNAPNGSFTGGGRRVVSSNRSTNAASTSASCLASVMEDDAQQHQKTIEWAKVLEEEKIKAREAARMERRDSRSVNALSNRPLPPTSLGALVPANCTEEGSASDTTDGTFAMDDAECLAAPTRTYTSDELQELRAEAERTLDRLTSAVPQQSAEELSIARLNSLASSRSSSPTCMGSSPGTDEHSNEVSRIEEQRVAADGSEHLASISNLPITAALATVYPDKTTAVRVGKYLRRCQISGSVPSLDDVHNIVLNCEIDKEASKKRMKAHRVAVDKTFNYLSVRTLAATLVVSLWICAQRSPYARTARRAAESFRPFAAGVFFFMNRGLMTGEGSQKRTLIPVCRQIYDALPAARAVHRGTAVHQVHLSAHKGVKTLCRCFSSVPSKHQLTFFADAILAAEALAGA